MAEWTLSPTIEQDIEEALERAKGLPPLPAALSAEYDAPLDIVILRIDDGRRLVIPREELQGLESATQEQLADIQIFGGTDIAWPQLDVDHYLLHLLEGKYASERWKEQRKQQVAAA